MVVHKKGSDAVFRHMLISRAGRSHGDCTGVIERGADGSAIALRCKHVNARVVVIMEASPLGGTDSLLWLDGYWVASATLTRSWRRSMERRHRWCR